MKHSWRKHLTLACLFISIIFGSGVAEAKRLGGGRNVGKQSNNVTQQRHTQQAQPTTPAPQTPAATPPKRNWGAILGGAAAGLGLGMLLSHFGGAGMMSGLGNIFIILALLMVGVWLFRKLRANTSSSKSPYATATSAGPANGPSSSAMTGFAQTATTEPHNPSTYAPSPFAQNQQIAGNATPFEKSNWSIPADFDTEAFLRHAKVYFVRLQAAWDAGNMDDIREFTSPEMFAEIYADLSARGNDTNKTDVITLEAAVLGLEQLGNNYIASVRFSGMIRENAQANAEPFNEVWNLSKPMQGSGGWVLAGIQQH